MSTGKARLALAGGLITLAIAMLVRVAGITSLPALDLGVHAKIGQAMAMEVADQLAREGTIVLVRPKASFEMPPIETQLDAFRKAVGGFRKLKIVAEEEIVLEQMGPLDGMLTRERYESIAQKYQGVDAMVAFVGPGDFGPRPVRPPNSPALFVVSMNYRLPWDLIESRFVAAAVMPRWLDQEADREQAPADSFERKYELATALNRN